MSTVAFFDPVGGAAGDMFLGALVDAGLPVEVLQDVVRALGLHDVEVRAERVLRGPLAATKVHVLVGGRSPDPDPGHAPRAYGEDPEHHHDHDRGHDHAHGRSATAILDAIRGAHALPPEARADAVRVFERLAAAEAAVHGAEPGTVHFHEVGAADALVDVVGTCVGLCRLGVTEVRVGALPWSSGRIVTAHGILPLPPPAVAHLLVGHPTWPSPEARELVTPTAAALVRGLSRSSTPPAGFVPRAIGLGAGTHDKGPTPNVLRVVLGEVGEAGTPEDAVLLEVNLDDVTGQVVARAIEAALAAGALDAWAVPATMKKGRPGLVLSVLAAPADVVALERVLFRETPTLGIRRRACARTVLPRRHVTVSTPWGPVRMKVRETPDGTEATPEHDDARAAAERHGVALRTVLARADAAWRRGAGDESGSTG